MKQKLLLICQHFYPEMVSTGLHMTELAVTINNNFPAFDIEVLCSYPSKNTFTEKDITSNYKHVNIIRKKSNGQEHGSVISRFLFSFSFFIRVAWYLVWNRKKYAGYVITTNPPFLGLATVFMKKAFKKRYFLIVYDVYPDIAVQLGILSKNALITKIWNNVTLAILKNAACLSVIGRDMEKIIFSKVKGIREKSVLIHNWADATHVKPINDNENIFLKQNPSLHNKTLFVYSGNMGRTHNMEDIVALANVFEADKDCMFVIIGGGAKYKYVQNAAAVTKNILVLPYQPFEVLPQVLSASTFCLVCLDSAFTGYSVPSKTYGIMAAAKPLIAFLDKNSEIGIAIEEAKCGFVVSAGDDLHALKSGIRNSIQTGAISIMGNNALDAFLKNYTLTLSAEKYYNAFRKTFTKAL